MDNLSSFRYQEQVIPVFQQSVIKSYCYLESFNAIKISIFVVDILCYMNWQFIFFLILWIK